MISSAVSHVELVDELLAFITIDRVTTWTPSALGVHHPLFDSMVQRLFELEALELVDVLSLTRNQVEGRHLLTQVKFIKTG